MISINTAPGVTSFNTRTGAVTLSSSDVTTALGYVPGSGSGTVTSVAMTSTDFAITGSPITTSGTLVANLNTTAVVAGSYTYGNFTVDNKGRLTAASSSTPVTSLTGTANQITASASTGAVTLSLPTTITGLSSITSTTFVGALTGAASSNVLKAGDTMTGALSIIAGSASVPGLSFSGDTNTGIFNPAVNQIGFSADGVQQATIYTDGLYMFNKIFAIDGVAGLPGYTFTGDTDTGIYRSAADTIDFSTNATNRLSLSTTKLSSTVDIAVTTAGKGFQVKEGSNAKMGTATLVGGTVTVSTTAVTASSRIFLTIASLGTVTVPTVIGVTANTPNTSFVITSANVLDTSVINWIIFEPA